LGKQGSLLENLVHIFCCCALLVAQKPNLNREHAIWLPQTTAKRLFCGGLTTY
jgi:hypothetical protein